MNAGFNNDLYVTGDLTVNPLATFSAGNVALRTCPQAGQTLTIDAPGLVARDLICQRSGATLRFAAGTTSTFTNTTLEGAMGAPLVIDSDDGMGVFNIDVGNVVSADYLDISNSNNTSGATVNPTNSVDGGNTSGWFAPAGPCGGLQEFIGDVVLTNIAQVSAFNGTGDQCINGNLTITDGVSANVQLTNLQLVTGILTVNDVVDFDGPRPRPTDTGGRYRHRPQ